MRWYHETFRATVALVVASVCLIGPGLAGVGGSPALGAALLGLGLGLFGARERVRGALAAIDRRLSAHAVALWLGPAIAGVVCLLAPTATADELQALGGLVGLAGMANYFLRPVYRLGDGVVRALLGAGS